MNAASCAQWPGVFAVSDFERLADKLGQIAGSFILSINDTPGAREGSAGSRWKRCR